MNDADSSRLILASSVEIERVTEFPVSLRERMDAAETDFIVSDHQSRSPSIRIDDETAQFLELFREPKSILDAVIAHCARHGKNPLTILDEAYPLVVSMRNRGLLIDSAYEAATGTVSGLLRAGERLGEVEVLNCIHAVKDTMIYRGRRSDGAPVIVKSCVGENSNFGVRSLQRELDALRDLTSAVPVPAIVDFEISPGRAYIVLEQIDGRDVAIFARDQSLTEDLRMQAAIALVDAYARLHEAGYLHGDVNQGNALVRADGSVCLVDFGNAVPLRDVGEAPHDRVGVVSCYEPELARAIANGSPKPRPSPVGEQYSAATLAYLLICGNTYLRFSLETAESLRQILGTPPRPFGEFSLSSTAVEQVIRRALAKAPEDRYSTVREFCMALQEASKKEKLVRPAQGAAGRSLRPASARVEQTLLQERVDAFRARHAIRDRAPEMDGPGTANAFLYDGAGGIAYFFLRLACLRESSEDLRAADVWITRALLESDRKATPSPNDVLFPNTNPLSTFHGPAGLHLIDAMIRHASGSPPEAAEAISRFIAEADKALERSTDEFRCDTTNGTSGLLLAAGLLLPICRSDERMPIERFLTTANSLRSRTIEEMASLFNPAKCLSPEYLGFAHGYAGTLHSLIAWSEVLGGPPPTDLAEMCGKLLEYSIRKTSGAAWPLQRNRKDGPYWTGWCHGSAGHILAWNAAFRLFGHEEYLAVSMASAEFLWNHRGQSGPSLCCGLAGEGLALFDLAKLAHSGKWSDQGAQLVMQTVASSAESPTGVFKGLGGIALACAEAMNPMMSSWPVCQSPL